jgi:hypothetical protein
MSLFEIGKALLYLQDLGIPDHYMPTPDIVLVGDRSAGISSIQTGVVRLHMPLRSRCCVRIRTAHSAIPSFRIMLKTLFAYRPGRVDNTFGHWRHQAPTTEVFATG